jgi:hypothetical protein
LERLPAACNGREISFRSLAIDFEEVANDFRSLEIVGERVADGFRPVQTVCRSAGDVFRWLEGAYG